MSLFYTSPSDDNDGHVCGGSTAETLTEGSTCNQAQTPTTRMRIISKRMRSGNHKYSTGDFSTGDHEPADRVDATVRAFAQSLKMNEIFSLDNDQDSVNAAADDKNGAFTTTDSLYDSEAMTTPPPAKRIAIEKLEHHRRLGGISPPPTPGRNHAAARSYHTSLGHPTFLPMGDRRRLKAPGSSHRSTTTMPSSAPGPTKVPSSLLDVYPQSASYRIRPNFASAWLQDLINDQSKKSPQHQEGSDEIDNSLSTVGSVQIPELPFAPPLYPPSRQLEHHVQRQHHQQQEEGSPKVAADMAVASLPPTLGNFERANAA